MHYNMGSTFKYFAFISYSSKDTEWGKRLQKKLERYKMPATLCIERGWERRPINPVFFAPTDILPGGLTEELQERLRASRHLIVICSPNSAQSDWVGEEIKYFHSLGRTKNIHFFIIKGTPHSGDPKTECIHPIVNKLELPEILGANIHEKVYFRPWLNRERAYVQLISKLLGVEFDAIWQRHKRMLVRRAIAWAVGSVAVVGALLCVWRTNRPFNVEVRLNEASAHNENLPPLKYAIVTLHLDNETKPIIDTIRTLDTCIVFSHIPHSYLNKMVEFHVSCPIFHDLDSDKCPVFYDLDTTVSLASNITLDIRRNPNYYGKIVFKLWDWQTETAFPNTSVQVDGINCVSDSCGLIKLFIPLECQDSCYRVTAPFPLVNNILTMPCGEGFAIVKE